MAKKIIILTILLALVAAVSYIFYLNLDSVTFTYSPSGSLTAPLGLVLIGIFSSAVILTSAIFLLFIAWNKLQIRKLNKTISLEELHHEQIIKAREALATENFAEAKSLLKKLNKKYPDDVVTRILLAQTLREEGNSDEALKVLEEARAEQKENLELLFETAIANELRGNFTAAYDNAMLMLKKAPFNTRALKLSSYYAEELGKFDEAIEHQKKLVEITKGEEQEDAQYLIAHLMLQKAATLTSDSEKKALLEKTLKEHRNYSPALVGLAEIESNKDAAAKLLQKAYSVDNDPQIIEYIIELYKETPEKAISATKKAIANCKESDELLVESSILLINFLIEQNKSEDALDEVQKLKTISSLSTYHQKRIEIIESVVLSNDVDLKKAKKVISEIVLNPSSFI